MNWIRLFATKSLLLASLLMVCCSLLKAQDCENALELATESFDQRVFGEIKRLLTDCPPALLRIRSQKIRAYELLILALVNESTADSTKLEINKLLDLFKSDADYQPNKFLVTDKTTNDKIRTLIEDVIEDRKPKKKVIGRWLWIAGGAGVAAAVIWYATRPEEIPQLAEPPGPPPRP